MFLFLETTMSVTASGEGATALLRELFIPLYEVETL